MGIATSLCTSCATCFACQGARFAGKQAFNRSARVGFCVLFTLAMVVAWLMRDFAKPLIEKIPWIVDNEELDHGDRWFGVQAVYRISMGNFLFYIIMAIAMISVRYKNDKRAQTLHHGGWIIKALLWLGLNILPFLFPNKVIYVYGWVARIGSPIFLLIQLLILLDFAMSWNEAWVLKAEEGETKFYTYLLALTGTFYLVFIVMIGFLFKWFNPVSGCSLNLGFLITTVFICLGFTLVSLLPRFERTSVFVSGVVSVYCMYLCYSALASEPPDYRCNGIGNRLSAASGTALAGGMVLAIVAVVYAAFRAGSNTALFFTNNSGGADEEEGMKDTPLLEKGAESEADDKQESQAAQAEEEEEEDEDEDDPVSYNYSFFHAIFALASMYIAMLMTGWGTGGEYKEMMDVGWGSVWVKIATQWVTAAVYTWTMLAPAVFSERDFY